MVVLAPNHLLESKHRLSELGGKPAFLSIARSYYMAK